jgi:hypothetical protein
MLRGAFSKAVQRTALQDAQRMPNLWLGGEASILIFGKLHRKISKLCQKEFARRHGCECEQLAE